MNTRRAACSCGQLHVTIEGDPSRIALCHCLACQRRTGAVISNQARFHRDQVTIFGKSTEWMRTAESGNAMTYSFLFDMRINRVLGERRLSRTSKRRHRQLRRPQTSPRRQSRYGSSHVTPGFPCRPTRRPSVLRSRDSSDRGCPSSECHMPPPTRRVPNTDCAMITKTNWHRPLDQPEWI